MKLPAALLTQGRSARRRWTRSCPPSRRWPRGCGCRRRPRRTCRCGRPSGPWRWPRPAPAAATADIDFGAQHQEQASAITLPRPVPPPVIRMRSPFIRPGLNIRSSAVELGHVALPPGLARVRRGDAGSVKRREVGGLVALDMPLIGLLEFGRGEDSGRGEAYRLSRWHVGNSITQVAENSPGDRVGAMDDEAAAERRRVASMWVGSRRCRDMVTVRGGRWRRRTLGAPSMSPLVAVPLRRIDYLRGKGQ